MRNIVIAQGGGFYGSAFFTSNLSLSEIREKLEAAGIAPTVGSWGGKSLDFVHGADTTVSILPFEGEEQPRPVVLLDTGHCDQDLETLQTIKSLLS